MSPSPTEIYHGIVTYLSNHPEASGIGSEGLVEMGFGKADVLWDQLDALQERGLIVFDTTLLHGNYRKLIGGIKLTAHGQ